MNNLDVVGPLTRALRVVALEHSERCSVPLSKLFLESLDTETLDYIVGLLDGRTEPEADVTLCAILCYTSEHDPYASFTEEEVMDWMRKLALGATLESLSRAGFVTFDRVSVFDPSGIIMLTSNGSNP